MHKFVHAAIATALVITAVGPNKAFALAPVPVPVPVPVRVPVPIAGGASAGAGVAGGFIGFVGLLVTYDLIRRTTCSGDFLQLGGPGFTTPITPAMTVLPPRCAPAPVPVHKHPVLHAKG
jgi:hypothetical protein